MPLGLTAIMQQAIIVCIYLSSITTLHEKLNPYALLSLCNPTISFGESFYLITMLEYFKKPPGTATRV